jgi:UPF0755 protein
VTTRRLILLLVGLPLVLAFGVLVFLAVEYQSFVHTPFGSAEEKVVEVAPGAKLSETAQALETAGVVSDGTRFYLYARWEKADRKLKRGEYGFTGPMTPPEVLKELVEGRVKTYRVTVPEGLRLDEIAPLFAQAGVADEKAFLAAARDPELMARIGVPAKTAEGFLYPDTYLLAKGRKPSSIVEEMVSHFKLAYARTSRDPELPVALDELQAVTLASIVEKETGAPEERPRIACVFFNRLKLGMRLQTDPTVIYAVLLARGSFDGNLTREMLQTPHPYNTYTMTGLPPGPIANPGERSLMAVFHPDRCGDLYFVARGDGHSEFCSTLGCHDKNVQRYQVAPAHLAAAPARSPTSRKKAAHRVR